MLGENRITTGMSAPTMDRMLEEIGYHLLKDSAGRLSSNDNFCRLAAETFIDEQLMHLFDDLTDAAWTAMAYGLVVLDRNIYDIDEE